ncbi:MAG: PilZ domain-containing protein [Bryobacteraceae bacterium]|jgi:hypothetical protein
MEQRKSRRFKLQLPLSITRSGAERVALAGLTTDISSGGVLFTTEREPDFKGPIEYVVTLTHQGAQVINLRCMGKILRTDPMEFGREEGPRSYRVAATLERYEFMRGR